MSDLRLSYHKEDYFKRWRDSGYRDLEAHRLFVAAYEAANRLLLKGQRAR